ncbi:LytR family transcriptional regulator [Paenibacillus protaetiae]|uniref:LytR family transcriptional regulator n=2 Tax=Paenibacillus protaetiae TaxID=2509456 RepID=A0A4V0YFN3_9BACL|nr:LytR family transcriptional regulator [Paenibacillus protaetiae]
MLVVLVVVALYLGNIVKKAGDALDTSSTVDNVTVPAAESVKKKAVGIVLLGMDTRPKGGTMNTDVMMVAVFNPNTKTATVVSMPRDTLIELDGYKERKANSYYANFYNQAIEEKGLSKDAAKEDARQAMSRMMSKYYGIDIKYTGIINFQGFVDVVDALHGIKADVDINMRYVDTADGTNINLKKGVQTLNGQQTLDFVRYRKSNDGSNMSSDFDRNQRESQVLSLITDKMKSLNGVTKLGDVIEAVGKNFSIDMPSNEMQNMLKTYFGISSSDITLIQLEGTWKSPYVYLDESKLDEARAALQAKMAE